MGSGTVICGTCKKEVSSQAKYCRFCGTLLAQSNAESVVASASKARSGANGDPAATAYAPASGAAASSAAVSGFAAASAPKHASAANATAPVAPASSVASRGSAQAAASVAPYAQQVQNTPAVWGDAGRERSVAPMPPSASVEKPAGRKRLSKGALLGIICGVLGLAIIAVLLIVMLAGGDGSGEAQDSGAYSADAGASAGDSFESEQGAVVEPGSMEEIELDSAGLDPDGFELPIPGEGEMLYLGSLDFGPYAQTSKAAFILSADGKSLHDFSIFNKDLDLSLEGMSLSLSSIMVCNSGSFSIEGSEPIEMGDVVLSGLSFGDGVARGEVAYVFHFNDAINNNSFEVDFGSSSCDFYPVSVKETTPTDSF